MKTFILVSLLVCLTGCAWSPKVLVAPLEQPQRSVPAEDVDFFADSTEVQRPFRVIARLSVTGAERAYHRSRDRTRIIDALRSKAGALGADAVVVTLDYGFGGGPVDLRDTREEVDGVDVLGAAAVGIFSNRIHTIKAMAIVYEPVWSK